MDFQTLRSEKIYRHVLGTPTSDDIEVYHVRHRDVVGKGWIGIFNRNEFKTYKGVLNRTDLGLLKQTNGYKIVEIEKPVIANNIWSDDNLEITKEGISLEVAPDDVLFFGYEVPEE